MKVSLSTKIALAVVSLVAAGGILTGYLVYNNSTTALRESISSNQTNEASQTMDKIDRFLYERLVDMQSLSGRQQIQSFLSEPSQRTPVAATLLTNQLNDFKISSGTWSDLTILDSQGNLALPIGQQELADALAKEPSILKLYAAAVAGQTGYSDALSLQNGGGPVMLFMTPVRDQEAKNQPIVGVLVGELAWQANIDILRDLKDTNATLINQQGFSLGDNEPNSQNEVLSLNFSSSALFKASRKSASGSGVFQGLDQPNKTFLSSYVREAGYLEYRGNGWTLVLETSKSVAFAPAYHLDKTLIITFGGLFIVSSLTFLLVLRTLVLKPITNLKEVTGRLADGDFSLRTTISSSDELGSLGRDFNDMADKMQISNQKLHVRTREAQDEKNVLQAILDNLPVGVMVVKAPTGEPIMFNKAAQQMSGRPTRSDVGTAGYTETYDIIREDGSPYPPDELPLSIALRTGKPVMNDDVLFRHPDGTTVAIRSFSAPIVDNDGETRRAVTVIEDISVERTLERSREEFFSIASHELRTPLTAIRGNSDLIQQYYGDKLDDPNLKEMISDIHESSERLIGIVNDFLDTSRLEQNRMKFDLKALDLMTTAQSVIKEYQVTSSRQKIHLEVTVPHQPLPQVLADSNRTKQVLINLVGNALKFTEAGTVTISFTVQPGFVKVLISDTGRGMSIDAQKLLFKKFEQTGETVLTRDSVRGTGLGLYISKMIVENMGGKIKLESSEEDKGTTFSFSLPVFNGQKPEIVTTSPLTRP